MRVVLDDLASIKFTAETMKDVIDLAVLRGKAIAANVGNPNLVYEGTIESVVLTMGLCDSTSVS